MGALVLNDGSHGLAVNGAADVAAEHAADDDGHIVVTHQGKGRGVHHAEVAGQCFIIGDGFKFDGGPTVVTAPFLFGELFQLCGRDISDYLQFVPLDPYYRIRFHDGRIFNYSGDHDKMVEEVRKFNRWSPKFTLNI